MLKRNWLTGGNKKSTASYSSIISALGFNQQPLTLVQTGRLVVWILLLLAGGLTFQTANAANPPPPEIPFGSTRTNNLGTYTLVWPSTVNGMPITDIGENRNGAYYGVHAVSGTTSLTLANRTAANYQYLFFHNAGEICIPGGGEGGGGVCFPNVIQLGTSTVNVVLPPAPASISGPSNSSSLSYTISWADETAADTYELQRKENSGSWSTIQNDGNTSRLESGLTNNRTYYYRVRTCNDAGCSSWTPTISVFLLLPPSTPGTPSAPSTNFSGSYTVSYSAGGVVSYYQLQERVNGGSFSTFPNTSSTNRSFSNKSNATYGYRVRACNALSCSGYSGVRDVQVLRTPSVPGNISGPSVSSTGSFTLSWSGSSGSVSSYELQRLPEAGNWATIQNSLSTSRSESLADGIYSYRVRACNSLSCSGWTPTKGVVVQRPPTTPSSIGATGLSHSGSNQDINGAYTVTWGGSAGDVSAYELQEQTNSGSFSTIQNVLSNSRSISGKGNGNYGYRVRACNGTGCSSWTSTYTVGVIRTPGVPSSISAPSTDSDGSYTVSWGLASGIVTSYKLQEQVGSGNWSTIQNTNVFSRSITGKSNGNYSYRVQACNSLSCSGWSSTRTVTVNIPPPPPEIIGPTSSSTGTFSLSVNTTPANGFYAITLEEGYGLTQPQTPTTGSFSNLPSGVYTFHLLYCEYFPEPVNGNVCLPEANTSHSVTVTRDAEPSITTSTQVAGSTAYSASVNNRGGATINVPLIAPPGVNGFQPNLSLSYDSGRATDIADVHTVEDALGYGWQLNGLPRLHRCRIGLSGSNEIKLDTSDQLCLNGQRLIRVSGSSYWATNAEYRTETQSFVKVTRNTQGSGYRVEYPDGKVGIFGGTSDSYVNYPNFDDYAWYLSHMTDPMGGSMTVEYNSYVGYGMVYPKAIDYSGARIEFKYGPRNDQPSIQMGLGNLVEKQFYLRSHAVLHTVSMSINGNAVREYRLDSNNVSGRVRLERVQECGFDIYGSDRQCYLPLQFNWTGVTGSVSQYPIAVSQVTDGYGMQTQFAYTNLTTTTNPTNYTEKPFGNISGIANTTKQNIAVVDTFSKSTGLGAGSLKSWTYAYKDYPYKSTRNRGYIGFYEYRAKDETTLAVSYAQTRLDFPFQSAISRTVQTTNFIGNGGRETSRSEMSYVTKNLTNGTVFPYSNQYTTWGIKEDPIIGDVLSSTQRVTTICFRALSSGNCPSAGTEGEFITQTTVTQTNGIDISSVASPSFWGHVPTRSLTDIKHTSTATTNLQNTTSPWVVGAAIKSVRVDTEPGKQSKILDSAATYKPGTLVTQTMTSFPGDPELEATISRTFNGNLLASTTVDGIDTGPRTATLGLYVNGRYPGRVTNPLGHQTTISYDQRFGMANHVLDPNGYPTSVDYDQFGRTTRIETTDGTTATTSYERCDVVGCPAEVSATAVTKITTQTTHSNIQIAPISVVYLDSKGRRVLSELEAFNSSNGWQRQLTTYEAQGRIKSITAPYFSTQPVPSPSVTYDYEIFDPADETYRVDLVSYPGGSVKTRTISSPGARVVKRTELINTPGVGNESRLSDIVFNSLGQLTQVTEPQVNGTFSATHYKYDVQGNLTQVDIQELATQPFSNETTTVATMAYDRSGVRRQLYDTNTGTSFYDYNALGELIESTDAKGQTTRFEYDVLGRTKFRWDNYGAPNQVTNSYNYDPANAIGALASRTNGNGFTESYSYRAGDGKLTGINNTINIPGIGNQTYIHSFGYDNLDRPETITYPSGFTSVQEYNSRGFADELTDGVNLLQRIDEINNFGSVARTTLGNGLISRFGYQAGTGRLTTIQTGITATSKEIQDLEYKWRSNSSLYQRIDKRGTSSTGDDLVDTFAYDAMERLLSQTTSGGAIRKLSFDYDAFSNIKQKQTTAGFSSTDIDATNYNYNDPAKPHRLSSVQINGINNTLVYDLNGNITRYNAATGDDIFITYDGQDRVTDIALGASNNANTATAHDKFYYGPDGDRYLGVETWNNGSQKTYTVYLGAFEEVRPQNTNSNYNLIQKSNLGSVVHVRTVDAASIVDERLEYVHFDHQGSIDAVTDENGNLVNKTSFDAFGGRREDNWSRTISTPALDLIKQQEDEHYSRGYTAHEHLNRTGFVHMNGRVYDPRIGRFVSADPFVPVPTMTGSYNRYAYVFNNPLSFTDPSGFDPLDGCGDHCQQDVPSPDGHDYSALTTSDVMSLPEWPGDIPDNAPDNVPDNVPESNSSSSTGPVMDEIVVTGTAPDKMDEVQISPRSSGLTINGGGSWQVVSGPPLGTGCADCQANIAYMMAAEGAYLGIPMGGQELAELTGDSNGKFGSPVIAVGKAVAEFGVGLLPGGDLALCAIKGGCSTVDIALGVVGLVPGGGKVVALGAKGIIRGAKFLRKFFSKADDVVRSVGSQLNDITLSAAKQIDNLGNAAFTPKQLAALKNHPYLRAAFRGSAIDKLVRQIVKSDPQLSKRLSGLPNKGVDFTDSLTGEIFDITTMKQALGKFNKYGDNVIVIAY